MCMWVQQKVEWKNAESFFVLSFMEFYENIVCFKSNMQIQRLEVHISTSSCVRS